MSGEAGGSAGLEFDLGYDLFFFWVRLENGEFKVGLSDSSFDDADSNASSNRAELKVGKIHVIASNVGNSGFISVRRL